MKSEEIIPIFKCIADTQSPCEFSRIKRETFGMKHLVFKETSSSIKWNPCRSDQLFQITFTANKPIELNGFYLYGWEISESEIKEEQHFYTMLEADGKRISIEKFSEYMNGSRKQKLFSFKNRKYLEANKEYTISIHGLPIKKDFYYLRNNSSVDQHFGGVKFKLSSFNIFGGIYFTR